MNVAEKIKNYIDEKGLKQAYIADKAGIKRDAFCRSLSGKRNIPLDEYCKICLVLNVPPDFFIKSMANTETA